MKDFVATMVRSIVVIVAVTLLVSGLSAQPYTAHADPGPLTSDPGPDGAPVGPETARWSFHMKPGDDAQPQTFVIPLSQTDCDQAKRIAPTTYIQRGPCTGTLTVEQAPSSGSTSDSAGGASADGKGSTGGRSGTFLGSRTWLPDHGSLTMHPMATGCTPVGAVTPCKGEDQFGTVCGPNINGQFCVWHMTVHFAWVYNQLKVNHNYVDCSDRGGIFWSVDLDPGFPCSFYNDGDPRNLGWMEGGSDFIVTAQPKGVNVGQGHYIRIRAFSDGTYTEYGG